LWSHGRDLLLINGAALAVLSAEMWARGSAVQICLGAVFALVCPGYALVCWFYPVSGEFEPLERMALVAVFSIATLILVGIALSVSPWKLQAFTAIAGIESAVALTSVGAFVRRRALGIPAPLFTSRGIRIHLQSIVPAGAIALAGLLAWQASASLRQRPGTEFFIVPAPPAAGQVVQPGQEARLGRMVYVGLGIVSRERRATVYDVRVVAGPADLLKLDRIALAPGETWTRSVRFVVPSAPAQTGPRRVDVLLYRRDDPRPYRMLRLWVPAIATAQSLLHMPRGSREAAHR
jgi:uncharacterized membrane protein